MYVKNIFVQIFRNTQKSDFEQRQKVLYVDPIMPPGKRNLTQRESRFNSKRLRGISIKNFVNYIK